MKKHISELLKNKILVLDGGFSTQIQKYNLKEPEYRRDSRLEKIETNLEGYYELLNLTRSDIVGDIHEKYLKYGADIIETNSFRANSYYLKLYGINNISSYELNMQAAKIAREKVVKYTNLTIKKPRFLAGSLGPLPEKINYADKVEIFSEQIKGLIAGRVDFILLETMTDYENIKAGVEALNSIMQKRNKTFDVIISVSETKNSYTPLTKDFIAQLQNTYTNVNILAIGENCGLGFEKIYQNIKKYNDFPFHIIAYPNNSSLDGTELSERQQLEYAKKMINEKLVNIIGGCCGTGYNLIRNLEKLTRNKPPRTLPKN